MGHWLLSYLTLGFLYGALATSLLALFARALQRRLSREALVFAFLTATFVFLTQHPFPDPGGLRCPVTAAEPQLRLFGYWPTLVTVYRSQGPLGWLWNKLLASTAMNFLLCAAIGAALARLTACSRAALALAVFLPLMVELTQLTGIWGLYACAYRQFDVDDLMLNGLGILTGFAALRMVPRRR